MLHVAPESCLESKFKKLLGNNYLTADLNNPRVMVKMDITNIQYPDEYFDSILCSHVLEHVLDDKKAMGEFYRVLKNNGWAILLVPLTAGKTIEDSTIVTPEDRQRVFGHPEHVRIYGKDYIDRLNSVGFQVNIIKAKDLVNDDEIKKMGLKEPVDPYGFQETEIYYCTKAEA
jgi:predicted SAM-dependent methyltransferase